MSRFQNFAADAAKKKLFFETRLRAVLINELIPINLGPNILRSCFLHCPNRLILQKRLQLSRSFLPLGNPARLRSSGRRIPKGPLYFFGESKPFVLFHL
jgi:hypothetical protein